jgi:hypothetical protein
VDEVTADKERVPDFFPGAARGAKRASANTKSRKLLLCMRVMQNPGALPATLATVRRAALAAAAFGRADAGELARLRPALRLGFWPGRQSRKAIGCRD